MAIYEPREDSYLLEKEISKLSKNKSVLDLGTGSGIQTAAALQAGAKSITAADINKTAIILLKEKYKGNKRITIKKSNLFSNIRDKFDIIAFNPPYLPRDKEEPKDSQLATTGGEKGDEITLKFLNPAKSHLNKGGFILLVISSLTPRDKILKLLKKKGLVRQVLASKALFFETLELWQITAD